MTYKQFEVLVVPFPFTEKYFHKKRPAVILSSDAFNESHDHLVLAMITVASSSKWVSDVMIENWKETGLTKSCCARFKLFTLPQTLIIKNLGKLVGVDREKLRFSMDKFLMQ